MSILLDDTRRREYHEHLERRLDLEKNRTKSDAGDTFLSALLAVQPAPGCAPLRAVPPPGANGHAGGPDAAGSNVVEPAACRQETPRPITPFNVPAGTFDPSAGTPPLPEASP